MARYASRLNSLRPNIDGIYTNSSVRNIWEFDQERREATLASDKNKIYIKKTAVLNTLVTMTIVLDVENSKN